uniref:Uncharacterized protein n=1 Tax=Setaria italica TaxID=4555 RepID=K3YF63_SETIT
MRCCVRVRVRTYMCTHTRPLGDDGVCTCLYATSWCMQEFACDSTHSVM